LDSINIMRYKKILGSIFLFVFGTTAAFSQVNALSDLSRRVRATDARFSQGNFECIETFSTGSEHGSKIRRVVLTFNNSNDFCLRGIKPDSLLTNCYYRNTDFTYDKTSKNIELNKSDESPYKISNPLLGEHPGACIVIGRGLSYIDQLKIEEENADSLTFSGNKRFPNNQNMTVRGVLDVKRDHLIKSLHVFFDGKIVQKWKCLESSSATGKTVCVRGEMEKYNFEKLISVSTIQIRNYRFGSRQKVEILNSVPRKTITDSRFEATVHYEDLPKYIDLDKLTSTSKYKAKFQRAALDRSAVDSSIGQWGGIIKAIVIVALTFMGVIIGRRLYKSKNAAPH
jgi:hypothetical protein